MDIASIQINGEWVEEYDIVVATDSDHCLTENKPYVVMDINVVDIITVKNDEGIVDTYSTEWFEKYNVEKHGLLFKW